MLKWSNYSGSAVRRSEYSSLRRRLAPLRASNLAFARCKTQCLTYCLTDILTDRRIHLEPPLPLLRPSLKCGDVSPRHCASRLFRLPLSATLLHLLARPLKGRLAWPSLNVSLRTLVCDSLHCPALPAAADRAGVALNALSAPIDH